MRAGVEHPQPDHRRQIGHWCGHPDAQDHREAGARPGRPRPRRGLRGPRPDRRSRRPARRDVRVPVVHPTRPPAPRRRARLRPRPHGPPRQGGATCTCQLAPLCRRHHRLKTHGGWTYTTLEPGTYLGRARTATSTSATTPEPSTSPATNAHPHPGQTTSRPAEVANTDQEPPRSVIMPASTTSAAATSASPEISTAARPSGASHRPVESKVRRASSTTIPAWIAVARPQPT